MTIRNFACCIVLLGVIGISPARAVESNSTGSVVSDVPRLALVVTGSKEADNLQAELTARLAADKAWALVERGQIEFLLKEKEFGTLVSIPDQRAHLGRLLGLDGFVQVRSADQTGDTWFLELIDARSGRLVGSETLRAKPPGVNRGEFLGSAVTAFLHQHLVAITARASDRGRTVAVLDFETIGDGTDGQATALRLSEELRERLGRRDLPVVDRSLTHSVAREKALGRAGFTEGGRRSLVLLGAEWLVTGEFHAGAKPYFELSALNVPRGADVAKRRFELESRDGLIRFPSAAESWLVSVMAGESEKAAAAQPFELTIQAEALQPFYRGVSKFSVGDDWGAVAEFEQASLLNQKFEDAYLWEARCYDRLGFPYLAEALRRFVRIGLIARGSSAYGKGNAGDGIMFLGITGGPLVQQSEKLRNLEMLVVNGLVQKQNKPVRLAGELARLRDEYDQLVGTPDVQGTRWQDAPNLLSGKCISGNLQSAGEKPVLKITVLDILTGELLAERSYELPQNETTWPETVPQIIAAALTVESSAKSPAAAASPPVQPVEDLARLVTSGDPSQANVALLQLMQADPTNKALWGRQLRRGADLEEAVQGYVNFALNEEWLARLPKSHLWHAWVELAQMLQFQPWKPKGLLFSDQKRDFTTDIQAFISAHPDDAPGAVAGFVALQEQIAQFPPDELAHRLWDVQYRLETYAKKPGYAALNRLADMARQLRELVLIAAGSSGAPRSFPKPQGSYPFHIRLVFRGNEVIDYEMLHSLGWAATEGTQFEDSQVDLFQEACAALYIIYGREQDAFTPDPDLIRKFPNSYGLLPFVIQALHESNYWLGFPMRHPLDGVSERKQYRAWVDYAYNELKREIPLSKKSNDVWRKEVWSRALIHELLLWNLINEVPDKEFETMRSELSRMLQEAETRCGTYRREPEFADWRTLSRIPPAEMAVSYRENIPDKILNFEYLATQEERIGSHCWSQHPLLDRSWVKMIHNYPFSDMARKDLCQLYLRRLPRLEQLCGKGELSYDEQTLVMDFALVMYLNDKIQEAEPLFRRIVENPVNDLAPAETTRELRANAALRLGWVLRASGRKAEALDAARLALELSGPRNFNVITRISTDRVDYDWGESCQVRETALRLLNELRSSENGSRQDKKIVQFVVRTPDISNAELIWHVRVPRGYRPDNSTPYRILIIVPSLNEGAYAYCADASPWASFADTEKVFLLLPQFVYLDLSGSGGFQSPQIWSGQALLDALAELRSRYQVQTDKLLLHGYGAGAQFAHRFALWKPELVSALSAHSAGFWTPADFALGLHPVSALRGIPCLVTCGEGDDRRVKTLQRLGASLRWVTFAREAGVPVLWKIWPDETHERSERMERLARAFLSACLKKDQPTKGKQWVVDLRDGHCYRADDQQVKKLPVNYVETLPSESFMNTWNEKP